MTDDSEFKHLVRQRMEATGEKYTEAHRALLHAARADVVPLNRRVLPRIAAWYPGDRVPDAIIVRLYDRVRLDLDESDLHAYLAADEIDRDDFVRERLRDVLEDLLDNEDLIRSHSMLFVDQAEDNRVRSEADWLGVTPDQYAWLEERLTGDEFSQLTDEAIHQLIKREYTAYPQSSRSSEHR